MLEMIQRVEFKTNLHPDGLQSKDLKEIRQDEHIFVKADERSNYYKTEPNDYTTLVNKNVTKSYKKADNNVPKVISFDDGQ